jgi:hypothetical protein
MIQYVAFPAGSMLTGIFYFDWGHTKGHILQHKKIR